MAIAAPPDSPGAARSRPTQLAAPARRWIRDELATLDPKADHERYAHLLMNVALGDAPVVGALYTVAFIRQMAIPSIARVVHRGGRSPIMVATRRRNDDGMFFFGEFMRLGPSSAQGSAAVARVRAIHEHFPIEDHQQRFTLSSLMFEGALACELTRVPLLSARDHEAVFWFWRSVGEGLGIEDLPSSVQDGLHWMRDYQAEYGGYTPGGAAVAEAMLRDFELRMPAPVRPTARMLALALCGPELRAHLRLADPGRRGDAALRWALRSYRAWSAVRRDPADRSWGDAFPPAHAPSADYENVGYSPQRRT